MSQGEMHWLTLRTNSTYISPEWTTDSISGLVGCMLLATSLSMTYEGLRFFIQCQEEKITSPGAKRQEVSCRPTLRHLALTVVNVLKTIVVCLLILSINTLNVWILISTVVGAGVGYLLFRPVILHLLMRNRACHSKNTDADMHPLFYQPVTLDDTQTSDNNNILRKYFGSVRNHLDYLQKTDIYATMETSYQHEEATPVYARFQTTGHVEDANEENEEQNVKNLTFAELGSEERWKFVRDTFKRVSRTRLQCRKQRGLPARIEQMGGLNDTFEVEMDTWVQNESDMTHDKSHLYLKPATMYVTVV